MIVLALADVAFEAASGWLWPPHRSTRLDAGQIAATIRSAKVAPDW